MKVTLNHIIDQKKKVLEEDEKLLKLKESYCEQNKEHNKGDLVFAKEYDSDKDYQKFKIIKAKIKRNSTKIIYVANKINKDGSLKKSSRSFYGYMVYELESKNIKK